MFNRVSILSASAGAEHAPAADALDKAFSQSGAAREIRHIDVVFRHLYSKAYLDMVNRMPEVMGWLYDHLDKPWKNERCRLALDETRMHMEKLGIHPGKLTVSGIHPLQFCRPVARVLHSTFLNADSSKIDRENRLNGS